MATEIDGATTSNVCVTGASGFIGSWLVKRLLERGYAVKATVRDPDNKEKVKHLLGLPNASTRLSLWKADLDEEGSFDDAIDGCVGVFHVATSMNFYIAKDPENDFIKPTINGVLNVLRSCVKGKTVKRIVYTSTIGSMQIQPQPPSEYNESLWTDVEFCRAKKIFAWMYLVAKTEAEAAAWKFSEENGIDLVTVHPASVIGTSISPNSSTSTAIALALLMKNEVLYEILNQGSAVSVEDACDAHIFLLEHQQAKGRYICSSHDFTIFELANSLSKKYPKYNIPTKFEGVNELERAIPFSSKKLLDLGFKFKFNSEEKDVGDLFAIAIEDSKKKGLLPPPK